MRPHCQPLQKLVCIQVQLYLECFEEIDSHYLMQFGRKFRGKSINLSCFVGKPYVVVSAISFSSFRTKFLTEKQYWSFWHYLFSPPSLGLIYVACLTWLDSICSCCCVIFLTLALGSCKMYCLYTERANSSTSE